MSRRADIVNLVSRSVATAILLLAIAVRSLIPPGYMAAHPEAGRGFAVTICSSYGPSTLLLHSQRGVEADDVETQDGGDPGDRWISDASCVFANIAPFDPPLSGGVIPAPLGATIAATTTLRAQRPGLGLAAPPPFPTGPPFSA